MTLKPVRKNASSSFKQLKKADFLSPSPRLEAFSPTKETTLLSSSQKIKLPKKKIYLTADRKSLIQNTPRKTSYSTKALIDLKQGLKERINSVRKNNKNA